MLAVNTPAFGTVFGAQTAADIVAGKKPEPPAGEAVVTRPMAGKETPAARVESAPPTAALAGSGPVMEWTWVHSACVPFTPDG